MILRSRVLRRVTHMSPWRHLTLWQPWKSGGCTGSTGRKNGLMSRTHTDTHTRYMWYMRSGKSVRCWPVHEAHVVKVHQGQRDLRRVELGPRLVQPPVLRCIDRVLCVCVGQKACFRLQYNEVHHYSTILVFTSTFALYFAIYWATNTVSTEYGVRFDNKFDCWYYSRLPKKPPPL